MKYQIIYADLPWQYDDKCHAGKRGVEYKYNVIPVKDAQNLPVAQVASDDSALFMWATCPHFPDALAVMEAWGYKYKTIAFTWVKTNKKSFTLHWGMGNWTRANAEHVLLGIKGKPKRIHKGVHSVIIRPVLGHSCKPPEVRHQIVKLMGDVPRIELFARERVPGWDAIGDAIDGMDIRESLEQQVRKAWSW